MPQRFHTRTIMIPLAAILMLTHVGRADDDLTPERAAMEKLSYMVGHWRGESQLNPGGDGPSARAAEEVSLRMNGTLLVIEGYSESESDPQDASESLALVWFDSATSEYRMAAFVDGRVIYPDVERQDEGLTWHAEVDGVQIRQRLTFDGDRWEQAGEISRDGESWEPFFRMNLERRSEDP